MDWPWTTRWRRERDRALIRMAQLEAKLEVAHESLESLQLGFQEQQAALRRVVDNALFAAGASPVFEPEAARFRPRAVEAQQAEAERHKPVLSAEEWRRKVEALDAEAAERDRWARLVEELKQVAEEAKRGATGQEAQGDRGGDWDREAASAGRNERRGPDGSDGEAAATRGGCGGGVYRASAAARNV